MKSFLSKVCICSMITGLLLTTGCGTVRIEFPTGGKDSGVSVPSVLPSPLIGRADAAWRLGDMKNAEKLYAQLRQDPNLPPDQFDTVFSRLNASALANGNTDTAIDALRAWTLANPEASTGESWLSAWGKTMIKAPSDKALLQAGRVIGDVMARSSLRAQAFGVILVRGDADARLDAAESLKALYVTSDYTQKLGMERCLSDMVPFLSRDGLDELLLYSVPETERSFPWSVLLLEKARRESVRGAFGGDVETILDRINVPGVFADTELIKRTMAKDYSRESFTPVVSRVPLYPCTVALALPLSGNYGGIGNKIASGAQAACAALSRSGIEVRVLLIDTENPMWVEDIKALPRECVIVGGPLLPSSYAEIKRSRLHEAHAFFAFMSSLEGGDEGSFAWRFFSSPADQIDVLLKYANDAGIKRFSVLYPDDQYGRRMAGLFLASAPRINGFSVSAGAAYPAADISQWDDVVKKFVGTEMIGKVPASNAPFEAIFLPDSWEKSSLIIPYLFFNGEDRLLILGSSLWSQGLSKGMNLDSSNVRLTVYPAVWDQSRSTPAAKNLAALLEDGVSPDFWSGLGYDFVRFASALHLPPQWNAATVNRNLRTAECIDWSIAPLRWDAYGHVRQSLFVLNPGKKNDWIVSPKDMAVRIKDVRERYDRRIKAAQEKENLKKSVNNAG